MKIRKEGFWGENQRKVFRDTHSLLKKNPKIVLWGGGTLHSESTCVLHKEGMKHQGKISSTGPQIKKAAEEKQLIRKRWEHTHPARGRSTKKSPNETNNDEEMWRETSYGRGRKKKRHDYKG